MSENLIIGLMSMTVCLAIQCVIIGAALRLLIVLEKRGAVKLTLIWVSSLLTAVMLILKLFKKVPGFQLTVNGFGLCH